ncbi:hypothetical protein IMSAGC002_04598 [Lachnospiraceae bacterium]|nr:hypothetical protein IMSAGC002_04598 [Lachnospiraceae bacterium]
MYIMAALQTGHLRGQTAALMDTAIRMAGNMGRVEAALPMWQQNTVR